MTNIQSGRLSASLVSTLEGAGYVLSNPITTERLSELAAAAGSLPEGVVQYLSTSDGLVHRKLDSIYGSEGMLRPYPSSSLLPLKGDGCGNYDSVIVEPGLGFGAVVFWDHETSRAEYLVASSVPTYLAFLARYPVSERWTPDGQSHNDFVRLHDPEAARLLDDPRFRALVGPAGRVFTVEQPQPTPGQALPGVAREGINPFTKERVVLRPPPRRRMPPGSAR